jgi:hypothetical protein
MAKHGRAGSVASLETTYGVNGWHPHTHDLVFAMPGLLADTAAVAELRGEWVRILFKVGLGNHEKLADMHAHAFDLQGGNFAADYIAKFGREPSWSEAHELTKSHAKVGGRNLSGETHVTPFKLLEWYLAGDAQAGALFREYAEAFAGKRMLSWSPGLKKKLHIEELTDEQLADEAENALPDEELAADLDGEEWRLVLSRDARAELLYIAAKNGAEGVRCFLVELREHRPRSHGDAHDSHAAWATKLTYFSLPKKAA